MNKCSRCNVYVHNQHAHCPLCKKPLTKKEESITSYPIYKTNESQNKSDIKFKILLFLTITIIILSLVINTLTFKINPVLWSPIILVALIYLWVIIKDTILSNSHIGRKILFNYLTLSIFLLTIELCIGFTGWSTSYVIPLFGIVATFLMTLFAITNKSLWQKDIGYILSMFFINLIPTILFLFHISDIIWPCVAAVTYSLITILGMLIFYKREFKSEIQKRFHF